MIESPSWELHVLYEMHRNGTLALEGKLLELARARRDELLADPEVKKQWDLIEKAFDVIEAGPVRGEMSVEEEARMWKATLPPEEAKKVIAKIRERRAKYAHLPDTYGRHATPATVPLKKGRGSRKGRKRR